VLFAGCAGYHERALSPAASAQALEARSLKDPRLAAFIAAVSVPDRPVATVGQGEASPTWDLTTLTLAALYYHPSLDVARARLHAARAGVTTARARPNPSLSFEDLSFTPAAPAQWTVAPLINFLIETAGKREQRTKEARAQVDAARADLVSQSWQVRAGVRTALLELWGAGRRRALLKQELDLQGQLTTLLEHRYSLGEASALELSRERSKLNQASLALGEAEAAGLRAREHLAGALAISLRSLEDTPVALGAFDAPAEMRDAPLLRRQALTGRSDLQGLLAQYAAAEAALALEIANQYPNLTVGLGYSFDSSENRYLLMPELQLPVFNLNRGPIAVAAARREEAAARFTALQSELIAAIDAANLEYEAAGRAVTLASALLQSERQREQQTERYFEAGAIDRPGLLTVQLERIAVAQSLLDAQLRQREALGALEDALQHPLLAPALPVRLEAPPRPEATP
jgi:outer membrane protein TolC